MQIRSPSRVIDIFYQTSRFKVDSNLQATYPPSLISLLTLQLCLVPLYSFTSTMIVRCHHLTHFYDFLSLSVVHRQPPSLCVGAETLSLTSLTIGLTVSYAVTHLFGGLCVFPASRSSVGASTCAKHVEIIGKRWQQWW